MYRIWFKDKDGKRRSIRLGRVTRRDADALRVKIDALLSATLSGNSLDRETVIWLADLGSELYDKLLTVGLVPERKRMNISDLFEQFIDNRHVKDSTLITYRNVKRNMVDFFGAEKAVHEIKPIDASEFYRNILGELSENTAKRRTGIARQVFRWAVLVEVIDRNPFDQSQIKVSVRSNKLRQRYIPAEDVIKIINTCPNHDWKLIFALTRFAGLRCPSEVLALKWTDVDRARNRFRITSKKTAHAGKHERWAPLFPELLKFLLPAEQDSSNRGFVIEGYRIANLGTRAQKIITRAGFDVWPSLFVNLRRSWVNDVRRNYPDAMARLWAGHTEGVSDEFYLQSVESDFERASHHGLQAVPLPIRVTEVETNADSA